MSVLASLVGSGAGIIVIALAMLLGRHYRNLPWQAHQWAERGIILLNFAGGSALAVTELGQWARDALLWAAGLLGGVGAGLSHVALVVSAMFMLAALVAGLAFAPTSVTAATATLMPLILSLAGSGLLHSVYLSTTGPAQAFASFLSQAIGG